MAPCSAQACNAAMRLPPSVHVELGPSRIAGAGIGALAIATLAVVLALPLAAWIQSAVTVGVVAWAYSAFRVVALRRGLAAVAAVTLAHNRMLVVRFGDSRSVTGLVRASTYVGPLLTSIVWRPDGARFSRAVLVLFDMLPAEDFRRLRVLLRYSRSDVAEAAPLSHS
jgi:hypothetical protein